MREIGVNKMLGRVFNYDNAEGLGFIKGFDDLNYFFHKMHIEKNCDIENGDLVEFDYLPYGENDLPYAVKIRKKA